MLRERAVKSVFKCFYNMVLHIHHIAMHRNIFVFACVCSYVCESGWCWQRLIVTIEYMHRSISIRRNSR